MGNFPKSSREKPLRRLAFCTKALKRKNRIWGKLTQYKPRLSILGQRGLSLRTYFMAIINSNQIGSLSGSFRRCLCFFISTSPLIPPLARGGRRGSEKFIPNHFINQFGYHKIGMVQSLNWRELHDIGPNDIFLFENCF